MIKILQKFMSGAGAKMGVAFLGVSLLVACSSNPTGPANIGDIKLTVGQTSYVVGDTVIATVRNTGSGSLEYNFCLTRIDRYDNDNSVWISVGNENGCVILPMSRLGPRQTVIVKRAIPDEPLGGLYRIAVPVLEQEIYQTFQVTTPPVLVAQ